MDLSPLEKNPEMIPNTTSRYYVAAALLVQKTHCFSTTNPCSRHKSQYIALFIYKFQKCDADPCKHYAVFPGIYVSDFIRTNLYFKLIGKCALEGVLNPCLKIEKFATATSYSSLYFPTKGRNRTILKEVKLHV